MILILNGSNSINGNSDHLIDYLKEKINYDRIYQDRIFTEVSLRNAKGIIFVTGTYWDSWGVPMQKILADLTPYEGTDLILGKPVSILVTDHSCGGKGVLSRLQGVLSSMGFLIPPMSGMVYSLASQLALKTESDFSSDFWCIDDLDVVSHNLIEAINKTNNWKAWPVDRKDPKRVWVDNQ